MERKPLPIAVVQTRADEVLNGTITDEGLKELAEALRDEPAAQDYYLELCEMHASLMLDAASERSLLSVTQQIEQQQIEQQQIEQTPSIEAPQSPVLGFLGGVVSFVSRPMVAPVLVAAMFAAWGLAMVSLWRVPEPRPRDVAVVPVEKAVARVTGLTPDCRWQEGAMARPLQAPLQAGEQLQLAAGLVQVEFADGAKVLLEGPATFAVVDAGSGSLESGKLTAQVVERAKGFAVDTPAGRVVDLGTEFGVEAADSKASVQVFKGKVRVAQHGTEAGRGGSRTLTAGQAVRIRAGGGKIESIDPSSMKFVRRMPSSDSFQITPEYVAAVKDSKPVVYWRFEDVASKVVKNEMGERYEGLIEGARPSPVPGGNRAILFDDPSSDRFVSCDEPLEALRGEGYSVELWVKPYRFQLGTLFGLIEKRYQKGKIQMAHAFSIELRPDLVSSKEKSPAKRIRFLHRSIPAPDPKAGTFIFSTSPYRVMRWQHIVAVKDGADLRLYVDGRLEATGVDSSNLSPEIEILAGRLNFMSRDRAMIGQLDEVAVYGRALSPEEVEGHYQLVRPEEAAVD